MEYETAKRHYVHVDCPGHADEGIMENEMKIFSKNLGLSREFLMNKI